MSADVIFLNSLEHREAEAIQGLRRSIQEIMELSYHSPKARDLLINDIADISGGALALTCVFKSLKCRIEAGEQIAAEDQIAAE